MWWCYLLTISWNKNFTQTHQNMGCESLHHQWKFYGKEHWWYIISWLFHGIYSYYRSYFYWNPDQPFVIHRAHHFWFGEYNYLLSIEDKHTPDYLLLQQDPEIHVHHLDLLNFIPCELDLTPTPIFDTTILTYEIELPPSGNKDGFNLLDDEKFTIPYIADKIPNSPAGHQLPTQATQNLWIIYINIEEPITAQGALDEINQHQNAFGESKVKISLIRRNNYQRTYIEDICAIFDQVRPVVSHLGVPPPPKKPDK